MSFSAEVGVNLRDMKTAERWFAEYAETHKNPMNKTIHMICVPAILWSILALLWSIPGPEIFSSVPYLNWATIVFAAALGFYWSLGVYYFLQMVAVGGIALILCGWLRAVGLPLPWIALAVFVAAWIGQFYGHKVEGKKPAFFQDLFFLLIGPLWVLPALSTVVVATAAALVGAALIAFVALGVLAPKAKSARDDSPASAVESFYRLYLSPATHGGSRAAIAFSKSFLELVKRNLEVCKEKAGTDVCGWGADGDIYLGAQESQPDLTFENSGAKIREEEGGVVSVTMNVYPDIKDAGDYYLRRVYFRLISEDGRWVVDDMKSSGSWAREEMRNEIEYYQNPPRKSEPEP